MRDKIYSFIAWIILIPCIPYYLIKGFIIGMKGYGLGKTKDEILEENGLK